MRTINARSERVIPGGLGAIMAIGLSMVAAAGTAEAQAPSPHMATTNFPGVYAFRQPPATFDPVKATDAELAAWGYRPRPGLAQGPNELARWRKEVTAPLHYVVPDLVRREGVVHRSAAGLRVVVRPSTPNTLGQSISPNWSGFVVVPGSGARPFNYVVGNWTVPIVKQAPGSCSGTDYSSQWVGIGGNADEYLLQAGSEADVSCILGFDFTTYLPWLEWLPNVEIDLYKNALQKILFPFGPGDYLIVAVWATDFSPDGVSKTGHLSFADMTRGWVASLTFSAKSVGGSEVTGQSAEWIVERPKVGKSFARLPDYVADPWWNTKATDLANLAHYPGLPGTSTVYDIVMHDDAGKSESHADLFGNDALWFFPEGSANH